MQLLYNIIGVFNLLEYPNNIKHMNKVLKIINHSILLNKIK